MPEGYYDVEISNLALIEACWGAAVADQAIDHVQMRLHHAGLRVAQDGVRGRFRIVCNMRRPGFVDHQHLADLPYRLSAEPISIERATNERAAALHAVISWQCDNLPRYRSPRDIQVDHQERWFAIYKSDMQIVAYLFRCMKEGRLAPHWQSVRDYRDPGQVLYHETLLRFSEPNEALSPGVVFLALERTGLASTFDWLMASHVIGELEAHPGVTLGVNISAHSAHLHGWWGSVIEDLRARPGLAQRLVVEITETEPLTHVADAVIFARRLRDCGVTLALDDFGTGYLSIRHLMELMPAFVKTDGAFVKRAICPIDPCYALPHIVGLVHALGGTVIVEGIETAGMADLAYVSGAIWQQGYFHGEPGLIRSGITRPLPRLPDYEQRRAPAQWRH